MIKTVIPKKPDPLSGWFSRRHPKDKVPPHVPNPLIVTKPPEPEVVYHDVAFYADIAAKIRFRGATFHVGTDSMANFRLRIDLPTTDSSYLQGGEAANMLLYTWVPFAGNLDEKAFLGLVWSSLQQALLHEAAEWFVYDDVIPFYPHS